MRLRRESVKQVILDTLLKKHIDHARVFLFGSQARKRAKCESDWDLLVLVDRELSSQETRELWLAIYRSLHEHFPREAFDVVVKTWSAFEQEKAVANTLASEVTLEGQEL